MTIDNPGARLLGRMNDFMGEVIDLGRLAARDDETFKVFRARVLRLGNDLIREFNAEALRSNVVYRVRPEDLRR